jgi:hypothetical protein
MPPNEPTTERLRVRLIWYAALALVTVAYLTHNLRLHRADLHVPLCPPRNDSAALLSLVRTVHESGWPWLATRLGAPGIAERYDYPLPEHVHYLTIRALAWATDDPFLTFNLWCLLSYPLTAVCAMAVFRCCGLLWPMGFVLALLYTFLPYHAGRVFSHTMLAYYHTVPLIALPAIWITVGRLPFFSAMDDAGRRRIAMWNGTTAWTVLLAIVVATTSPYYAFFGCFFLAVAGLYRGLNEHSWKPLASGLGVAAVVSAVGFACALPFVIAQREHGANPAVAQRHANEADVYCLKVTDLVLPYGGHRIEELGHVTRLYNKQAVFANENRDSVLGFVGTTGFLILLGRLLVSQRSLSGGIAFRRTAFPGRPLEGRPGKAVLQGPPSTSDATLSGLAVLNVSALLLGASGGLGGLFNFLVFAQIRCYNRVCVFIAFWSLLAIGLLLDRWLGGRPIRLWLAAAFLLAFGLWDTTNQAQAPRHSAQTAQHVAWTDFVTRMEEELPAGGMVFQLPATSYPELGTTHEMPDYSHLMCHAYSRTLRWSYGTCRNRRWDEWQQYVAGLSTREMVRALCLAEFKGIYVDRRGYPDRGERIIAELRVILGHEIVSSDRGEQVLFALGPTSGALCALEGAIQCTLERIRLMNRVCVLCQDGFLRRAPANPPEPWIATHTAVMRLINPGTQSRRVTLLMQWQRLGPVENAVAVTGSTLGVDRQLAPPVEPGPLQLEIDVPPGEHLLRFETTPRPIGLARMHPAWCATDVHLIERD